MKTYTMKYAALLVLLMSFRFGFSQSIENFQLKNLENEVQSFDELKGEKLTVIDFWTTFCKPCFKAMPYLNQIYETYKDSGVVVLGINSDGPRSTAKVAPMCNSIGISYPVLKDLNSDLMKKYQITVLPTLLFVDKDGNILETHEGFIGDDREVIEKTVAKLLNEL